MTVSIPQQNWELRDLPKSGEESLQDITEVNDGKKKPFAVEVYQV